MPLQHCNGFILMNPADGKRSSIQDSVGIIEVLILDSLFHMKWNKILTKFLWHSANACKPQ